MIGILILSGCGSETVQYQGNSDKTVKGEAEPGDHGQVVADLTLTHENDIVAAEFDVEDAEGNSRKEQEAAGEFDMGADVSYTEQIASLEAYVVENDAMPTLNEEGIDADGVTSATIDLTDYVTAFDAAMATADTTAQYYTVTYDKTGDDITNTRFDVVSVDGTYSKIADAEAGIYDMGTEVSYQDQVADLGRYVDEFDAFPETVGEGHETRAAEGLTTATIKIGEYKIAFESATPVE